MYSQMAAYSSAYTVHLPVELVNGCLWEGEAGKDGVMGTQETKGLKKMSSKTRNVLTSFVA